MTDQPYEGQRGQSPQPLLPFTAFDHLSLQKSQAANLRWCEAWARTLQPVAGVPIGQALTFDLIQLLNRSEIEQILGPAPDFAAIEAEMKRRMEVPAETLSAHPLAIEEGIPPLVVIPEVKKDDKRGKRRRLRNPVKWEAKP